MISPIVRLRVRDFGCWFSGFLSAWRLVCLICDSLAEKSISESRQASRGPITPTLVIRMNAMLCSSGVLLFQGSVNGPGLVRRQGNHFTIQNLSHFTGRSRRSHAPLYFRTQASPELTSQYWTVSSTCRYAFTILVDWKSRLPRFVLWWRAGLQKKSSSSWLYSASAQRYCCAQFWLSSNAMSCLE